MSDVQLENVSWERMISAVEKVRERVIRVARALDSAGILYAVVGGNAVAAWVSRVDESAARNTKDVDILIRRTDFGKASAVLEAAGFVRRHVAGMEVFLDGPDAKPRDAVHILFAGEKVQPEYPLAAADVSDSEETETFRLLSLEALVRMKLTSYRLKDRVHLLDLLEVGLIDESWCDRMPDELADRLRSVIENPDQ